MQPILDSFERDQVHKPWSATIEYQALLLVLTFVLFVLNSVLLVVLEPINQHLGTVITVLIYIMGNMTVLSLGYVFFKLSILLLKQLLKIIALDFLIQPLDLHFIPFACLLNTAVCLFLLYWMVSIP